MRERASEKGYVLITVAMLLFVLLSFLALAVDIGIAYSARTAAQRAADSAALAGAFTFVIDPTPEETDIKNRAIQQAAADQILGTPVTITAGDVNVDLANRRVTVTVERTQGRGNPVPTYFARMIRHSIDIRVEATAEASGSSVADTCTKPWIIPSTALSPTEFTPCQNCASQQVLVNTSGSLTSWGKGLLTRPLSERRFVIKPQDPTDALVPSNFYAIEINGSGAAAYREAISSCVPVTCGGTYRVEPGNMVGPTEQGVDALLGDNPDTLYFESGEHRFGPGDASRFDTSHQLVVAPIWDACSDPLFQEGGGGGGKGKGCDCPAECVAPGNNTWYTTAGYALIFVEGMGTLEGGGKGGDGVIVDIIGLWGCEGTTHDGSEVGPFSVPVRLVRVPD